MVSYANQHNDKNSAMRAEKLLKEMEYHTRTSSNNENNVNPDLTTYNTVMKSWANSRCVGAGKAAERLLLRVQDLHYKDNNDTKNKIDFLPDIISYNTVLNAHAKEEQQVVTIPSVSSSSPKTSYNNSSSNTNSNGAETFLRKMMDDYTSGKSNIKPDETTYNIVLDSYANQCKSDAAHKGM